MNFVEVALCSDGRFEIIDRIQMKKNMAFPMDWAKDEAKPNSVDARLFTGVDSYRWRSFLTCVYWLPETINLEMFE